MSLNNAFVQYNIKYTVYYKTSVSNNKISQISITILYLNCHGISLSENKCDILMNHGITENLLLTDSTLPFINNF